jgi:phage shock protein A
MKVEQYIKRLQELNEKVDDEISIQGHLEKNYGRCSDEADALEKQISEDLKLIDTLKLGLADAVLEEFTTADDDEEEDGCECSDLSEAVQVICDKLDEIKTCICCRKDEDDAF